MSEVALLLLTTAFLLVAGAGFLIGNIRSQRKADVSRTVAAFLRGDESYGQALLDNLSDAVVACDAHGKLSLLNRVARAWHGLPAEPLPADDWATHYDLYSGDGVTPLAKENIPLARAFNGETVRNAQIAIVRAGKPARFVLCSGGPILDEAGVKIGAVVVMHDVTEQRAAGQERLLTLSRVQRQHAAILRLSNETVVAGNSLEQNARLIAEICADTLEVDCTGIWLFSENRRQLYCLDRFERSSRTHVHDIKLAIEKYPRYLQALRETRIVDAFDACIDPRTSEFSDEYFRPRAVGATLDAGIRLNGELVGVVCNEHTGDTRRWTSDETNFAAAIADQMTHCLTTEQRQRVAEKLSYEAGHDVLTGLLNRWEFERQLRQSLDDSRNTGRQFALIHIGLDQFKIINENCGRAAGDQLLQQVGGLFDSGISGQTSGRGVVARQGGDEFAILLRDCKIDQAVQAAENLSKSLDSLRFSWEGRHFRIGASLGIVMSDQESNVEALLQAADAACYLAKEQGGDRLHIYQPDDADLVRRRSEMQWATRIRSALDENRLRLVRHSIAPLKTPPVGHHYEVLTRLVDETGQISNDASFLSVAEQYGFTPRIDTWVTSTTLDWLARNPQHLERLHLCSINLSGLSLSQEDFLHMLTRKLKEGIVPPEKICFEITETAAVTNLARAKAFMHTLREMGCKFSLDDFGSGLSSYAYLRDLEVDFLKIDGSFCA